jgi:2-C-methyl-D-erythritol 2,4-cyclodiphosphate synthase
MSFDNSPFRIGHGFDVHRFGEGDHLTLGGVKIPYTQGFEAHSDGDVLIHSVCDALLGAMAAGDIGQHFPDTDAAYKNINSRVLLEKVKAMIDADGYLVGNVDVTVVAQSPRIAPYTDSIARNLAADLNCSIHQINIKATTTEQLGYLGRKEGVAVHCVVLLLKR